MEVPENERLQGKLNGFVQAKQSRFWMSEGVLFSEVRLISIRTAKLVPISIIICVSLTVHDSPFIILQWYIADEILIFIHAIQNVSVCVKSPDWAIIEEWSCTLRCDYGLLPGLMNQQEFQFNAPGNNISQQENQSDCQNRIYLPVQTWMIIFNNWGLVA